MTILSIAIVGFIVLEASNVLALYFRPGTRNFNSVGVFKAWEKSKHDPEIHNFVRYLVYWVAGSKLIFIGLLLVILISGSDQTKLLAGLALVISIASFYWKLFPLIRSMDRDSQIDPRNYSTTLGIMIAIFLIVFIITVVIGYLA
jgi:hypothetical protein